MKRLDMGYEFSECEDFTFAMDDLMEHDQVVADMADAWDDYAVIRERR